ncbi:MAG TPA: TfoX/Sxy family protein [Steroidobacteraceae bacterium]|nr:TfoX/Sxy family protein [Steroidobacteraceae bacterium]
MSVSERFLAWVMEQLGGLDALRSNRMFGGIGLYSRDVFFGLIDDDTLFFKTDESNIAPYRERNMPKFMPFPDRPEAVLGYHQVPADVIEDAETLVQWARLSIGVQLALQAAKAARRRPRAPVAPGVKKKKMPAKKTSPKKSAPRKPSSARRKKTTPARRPAKTARRKK